MTIADSDTVLTLDGEVCSSLEATHWRDLFKISIDHPYAGDSETGIGRTLDFSLTRAQAAQLYEWLGRRLKA